MNYLILSLTVFLAKVNRKAFRLWLSAALGAAYCIVLFMPGMDALSYLPLKLLLSLAMVVLAFGWRGGVKGFIKHLLIFYGVSFFCGGIFFGMGYMFQDRAYNGVLITGFPLRYVLYGIFLVLVFSRLVKKLMASVKGGKVYPLEISICGMTKTVDALVDSGNSLLEPISGMPVIVVDEKMLDPLLPEELTSIFMADDHIGADVLNFAGKYSIRVLPFDTVGAQGNMLGLLPEKLFIFDDGKRLELGKAYIALSKRPLKGGNFGALLHPSLVADL